MQKTEITTEVSATYCPEDNKQTKSKMSILPTLNLTVSDARAGKLPSGFRVLEKGERMKSSDRVTDGWKKGGWEPIKNGFFGKRHDGSQTVLRYDPR